MIVFKRYIQTGPNRRALLTATWAHDDDCIYLCPIPASEKCRIGHSCWHSGEGWFQEEA